MAGDSSVPPPILWAQRNDKLYLTITVEDFKDSKIQLEEKTLCISGHGGTDDRKYEVKLEFYKEVDPSNSRYSVMSRNVPMMIMKKEDGPFWPHLLKEKAKVHWLKTDFDKWKDEDDSDYEGGDDMQLEDMMKQMGNFNSEAPFPGGGEGEEEQDSDDEELPDLE